MKYLYVVAMLAALPSCSREPIQYACVNPFMALQGIIIDPSSPMVKVGRTTIEVTTGEGNTVTLPKSLCAEVREAK